MFLQIEMASRFANLDDTLVRHDHYLHRFTDQHLSKRQRDFVESLVEMRHIAEFLQNVGLLLFQ